ncbi:hypothetical protein [Streptosporangium sp. NPDC048865]|uniref:hypothetical protein n=1 Tax=Streptosporangium sp. NPDC048865 TaxID=3155766 RepID=UPI00342416BA
MSLTSDLYEALTRHYRKPGLDQDGEILLPEVTAPGSGRRCDLLRIGLWPSRGWGIDVHELKTSRSDWLRELNDKAKADAWWPYCSRFWVAAPANLIHPSEVPPGWGLMEAPTAVNRRRFKVVVQPETREPTLNIALLAELVSRTDNVRLADFHRLRVDHRNELYQQEQKLRAERGSAELDWDTQQRLDLLAKVEKTLGMTLTRWASKRDTDSVTVEEFAAALGDFTREHVGLQRRARDLTDAEGRVRRAAELALSLVGEKPRDYKIEGTGHAE